MVDKKVLEEIEVIKNYEPHNIDYKTEKGVSYSQHSQFRTCKHMWSLNYPQKHRVFQPSIHTVFGTSLHETVQNWLDTAFNNSVKESENMDLESDILDNMISNYKKDLDRVNEAFTNKKEFQEFWLDGMRILNYLKNNRTKYFNSKNIILVGIETKIVQEIKPGVYFNGFLDLIIYDKKEDKYIIIDIKTSKSGWGDYMKKDDKKTDQLVLYKHFFSKQYNIDPSRIDVEYLITKRRPRTNGIFKSSVVQVFNPPSGKVKTNKALRVLQEFIDEAFTEDGEYVNKDYPTSPSKFNCMFCPFKENSYLCSDSYYKN